MASKSINADISYYFTVDEEKIVKRRRLFQYNNDNSNNNTSAVQRQTNKNPSRVSSVQTLAKTWLSHYDDISMRSSLLNDMIRLKRDLLFSINQFIHALNLSTLPSKDILPLLVSYHTWSKLTYDTLMPLISLLLPLIKIDSNGTNNKNILMNCFQQLYDEAILQDYMEAIINYLHFNSLNNVVDMGKEEKEIQKTNIILIQNWLDKLLEHDRKCIAFYSTSGKHHTSCSNLYMSYYDVFLGKNRLKYLSWNDKKRWIMKEWDIWIQLLMGKKDGDNEDHMQQWMQEKANMIQYENNMNGRYLTFIEKNVTWFNEFNPDISSSLINYIVDQLLAEKIIPITMIWGIYHCGCRKMISTGQDSIYVVKVLDDAKKFILQHLNDQSNVIAILLSVVQISLHHMNSILTYQQWFEVNFVKESTWCLQSKRQSQLWMIHLENMISYEIPTILQTQAKIYSNTRESSANNYISLVKKRLLALGVDGSLRNYPTTLFTMDGTFSHPINIDDNHLLKNNYNNSSGIQISDLEKLLNMYDETKTVPKGLWEDSIFRPKWFKLTFLPALMNWKLTDKKLIDNRRQLIEALNIKRKIPVNLYQQFINKQ